MRVDAHPRPRRHVEIDDAADGGPEVMRSVLGIDAAFDRASARSERFRDAPPGCHTQLLSYGIATEAKLRDWVLDLEPGVDLEEVEIVPVHQELGGARIAITGRPRELQRRFDHSIPHRRR